MKTRKKIIRFNAIGLSNILIFVFLLGVAFSPFAGTCSKGSSFVQADSDNPLGKSKAVEGAMVFQEALREIYNEVNPAVVRIETEQTVTMQVHPFFNDPAFRRFFGTPEGGTQKQKRAGLGSGFIISPDGYIITNHHVVQKVDKITIKFTNRKDATAKLIGSDPVSDIALLKVDGVKNLKTVHFGDSDKIEVGDIAIAIGNPFGLSSTFTMGVISSKGQDVNSADGINRIQTDAPINPGNSGGPLLNLRGEVVGINQMIYSQSGGSVGIGFAIPINHALHVIERLKTGKPIKQGYVGISILPDPTDEYLEALNIKDKKGLLVREVIVTAPAYKAGIRANDFIVEVDGKPATKFSVLKSAVASKGAGGEIKLKVFRDGDYKTFTVKIGELPAEGE